MNDKPFTITFYSYRGGADRLTALVNVGVELAQRGRKVLLADFDLEAPGLTALAPLRPEEPRAGLVEFVAEYLDTNQAPPVGEYLYRTPVGKKDGELWVMPAGKEDADYWAALARINWQELYDLHAGFLFFEDMRLQWQQKVKLGQQEVKFDYVLINSPGGINDLTGICTRQLPDLVMLLADPDGTDRAGLQLACAEIRAEAEEKPSKDIAVALALTGLPDSPDEDPRRLREYAASVAGDLGLDDVDALIHRGDRHSAEGRPRGRAAREYRRLALLCMMSNCENDRDGARWFLKRLQKDLTMDPFRAIDAPFEDERRQTTRRLDRVLAKFIRDAEIVLMGTACLFLARRHYMALYTLGLALEEQPDAVEILLRRAEYNAKWRTPEAIKDLRRVLEIREATPDQVRTAKRLLRILSPKDSGEARRTEDPASLLDSHLWKEVITLLEPRVNDSTDFSPWDAFYLAVAYWGATGQLRPDLCKCGIDKFREQQEESELSDLWRLQVLAVMYWGAGDGVKALEVLEAAESRAEVQRTGGKDRWFEFPTFWRGTLVSFDQFMEDCQELRSMFRMGSSPFIRPPYLDDTFEI